MKSLRFRIKTIIGVILMILSLLGILFWESEGREKVLMTPVLVTAREINAGELILGEDIIRINVPGDLRRASSRSGLARRGQDSRCLHPRQTADRSIDVERRERPPRAGRDGFLPGIRLDILEARLALRR